MGRMFLGLGGGTGRGRGCRVSLPVPSFSHFPGLPRAGGRSAGNVLGLSCFGSALHYSPPGNCQPPFLLSSFRPYSQDAVLGAGPRMEARAQSSRQEASPSQSPGGRQGTGEPPDGAEACGRGSSKETPVSEGRSARRDRRWPDDSPRQRLLGPGTRREPSPGTRQSAGAGLLVQEPNGPTSSRDPDLVPPQGLQAEEGSCSGEPGAALARGSPLRAPPRRSPRSIPSSGSFLPPPIPGLGPRPGRCHHCFPHRVICAQAATPRGVPLRPSMQSHPRLLAAAQAQLPLGPKPSWGILCAACPPFIHSVFFRPVPRR